MIIFNAISILKDDLNKNIPRIKRNLIDWTNKVKMILKEKNSCEFIEIFSFKNLTYNQLTQNLFILDALLLIVSP